MLNNYTFKKWCKHFRRQQSQCMAGTRENIPACQMDNKETVTQWHLSGLKGSVYLMIVLGTKDHTHAWSSLAQHLPGQCPHKGVGFNSSRLYLLAYSISASLICVVCRATLENKASTKLDNNKPALGYTYDSQEQAQASSSSRSSLHLLGSGHRQLTPACQGTLQPDPPSRVQA